MQPLALKQGNVYCETSQVLFVMDQFFQQRSSVAVDTAKPRVIQNRTQSPSLRFFFFHEFVIFGPIFFPCFFK